MGSSIKDLREWASEGESKAVSCFRLAEVEETEKKLRYEIKHMIVCDERMWDFITSSRVAPQESYSCPSIGLGWEFFYYKK